KNSIVPAVDCWNLGVRFDLERRFPDRFVRDHVRPILRKHLEGATCFGELGLRNAPTAGWGGPVFIDFWGVRVLGWQGSWLPIRIGEREREPSGEQDCPGGNASE